MQVSIVHVSMCKIYNLVLFYFLYFLLFSLPYGIVAFVIKSIINIINILNLECLRKKHNAIIPIYDTTNLLK